MQSFQGVVKGARVEASEELRYDHHVFDHIPFRVPAGTVGIVKEVITRKLRKEKYPGTPEEEREEIPAGKEDEAVGLVVNWPGGESGTTYLILTSDHVELVA